MNRLTSIERRNDDERITYLYYNNQLSQIVYGRYSDESDVDTPPDGAPSVLTLTVISDTSIKLDWTDGSTNEDGFSIERSTDGINYVEIDTVAANVVTYTNTGLTAGTLYYYRVRAFRN